VLAGYIKNLLADLNQITCSNRSSAKDQSIRFYYWSGSWPGYRIVFSNLVFLDIEWDNSESCQRMFVKHLDKEYFVRFWNWSGSGSRISFSTFPSLDVELKECLWHVLEVMNGVGGGLNCSYKLTLRKLSSYHIHIAALMFSFESTNYVASRHEQHHCVPYIGPSGVRWWCKGSEMRELSSAVVVRDKPWHTAV